MLSRKASHFLQILTLTSSVVKSPSGGFVSDEVLVPGGGEEDFVDLDGGFSCWGAAAESFLRCVFDFGPGRRPPANDFFTLGESILASLEPSAALEPGVFFVDGSSSSFSSILRLTITSSDFLASFSFASSPLGRFSLSAEDLCCLALLLKGFFLGFGLSSACPSSFLV